MALAHMTGKRIVEMVAEDLKLSQVLVMRVFKTRSLPMRLLGVHQCGRICWPLLGVLVSLSLKDIEIGTEVPLLVNCMPSGKYLMEDFCYAGGMPAVLAQIAPC